MASNFDALKIVVSSVRYPTFARELALGTAVKRRIAGTTCELFFHCVRLQVTFGPLTLKNEKASCLIFNGQTLVHSLHAPAPSSL
mmetsp:Transcript_46951/g.73315  ORF Transcript_46951/g.73315 Transcript_46951/m.73315 type:complete len:85 (+) Transcript_46951:286-540(+)